MRQNRASRFNRNMMVMMAFMAVVVLACVYMFLYMSLPQEAETGEEMTEEVADSLINAVEMFE